MKAYAIVINGNKVSELGYETMVKSSEVVGNDFEIQRYDAVTAEESLGQLAVLNLIWNYPWDKPVRDIATGLLKTPYPTKNYDARIACALSHYKLWLKCYKENEAIIILEHDAVWKQKLPEWVTDDSKYDIIGINDPRGATRRSRQFHESVQKKESLIQRPPVIDEEYVPQGIAGNSAYIMKPSGAKKMLDLVTEYGLWPNDAIMCRQLVRTLGVTKIYYTGVQGLPSTTSS
jgi:GR25 family glycosyltransferase involved in LPS biosynthesis